MQPDIVDFLIVMLAAGSILCFYLLLERALYNLYDTNSRRKGRRRNEGNA
jgi:hypothetical protein